MRLVGLPRVLLRIGLGHLHGHRRRLILTVVGVAAGVALVFATSVINETLHASISTTVRGAAGEAQLEVSAPPSAAGLDREIVREVARTPGVEAAIPVLRATSRIASPHGDRRISILGVPPDLDVLFDDGLGRAGRQVAALSGTEILLGPNASRGLGLIRTRDALRIQVPGGYQALADARPLATVPFGDVDGGSFALMRLDAAGPLFARHGLVDAVYVLAEDGASTPRLRDEIERRVAGRAFVGRPGSRSLPYERAFAALSQLTDLAVAGSLWVALFVVFNAMSMSLLERRREISLSFALGATRRQVAAALVAEAAILGMAAALVGIPAGYLLANALLDRSLEAYPLLPLTTSGSVLVTPATVGLAFASGPVIAVLGALVPTVRILGVAPTESMRVEPALEWAPADEHTPYRGTRSLLAGGAGIAAGSLAAASGAVVATPWWTGSAAIVLVLTGTLLLFPAVLPLLSRASRRGLGRVFGILGALAGDSLLHNPRRTAITVAVLALTAAAAIGLGISLGSFESEMRSSFLGRYGAPLYVTAGSYTGITSDQPLPPKVGRRLRHIEGVAGVYPLRYRPALFEGEQAVIASAPLGQQTRDGLRTALDKTRGARSRDTLVSGLARRGIVPSRFTASRHGLTIGETLEIPGPEGEMRLRVVGIFDDVLSVDSVYMERRTYRKLSGDSTVDHFGVAPAPGTSIDDLESRLERSLASHRTDAVVQTRDEVIDDILANVRGIFGIARGLQFVALLIAALVIANTMLTVVAERRWELSLTRMLGMTKSEVRSVILLEATAIGVIGSGAAIFIGLGIGFLMLVSMELRYSWAIDYQVQWQLMATVFTVGVGGAVAAALLAAHSAARAPLAESLRSD